MIKLNLLQKKVLTSLLSDILNNLQKSPNWGKFMTISTIEFDAFDTRALMNLQRKLNSDPDIFDFLAIQKVVYFYGQYGMIVSIAAYEADGTLIYHFFDSDGVKNDKTGIPKQIVSMINKKNSRFNKTIFNKKFEVFESQS